jgi:hypothetical protein
MSNGSSIDQSAAELLDSVAGLEKLAGWKSFEPSNEERGHDSAESSPDSITLVPVSLELASLDVAALGWASAGEAGLTGVDSWNVGCNDPPGSELKLLLFIVDEGA